MRAHSLSLHASYARGVCTGCNSGTPTPTQREREERKRSCRFGCVCVRAACWGATAGRWGTGRGGESERVYSIAKPEKKKGGRGKRCSESVKKTDKKKGRRRKSQLIILKKKRAVDDENVGTAPCHVLTRGSVGAGSLACPQRMYSMYVYVCVCVCRSVSLKKGGRWCGGRAYDALSSLRDYSLVASFPASLFSPLVSFSGGGGAGRCLRGGEEEQ